MISRPLRCCVGLLLVALPLVSQGQEESAGDDSALKSMGKLVASYEPPERYEVVVMYLAPDTKHVLLCTTERGETGRVGRYRVVETASGNTKDILYEWNGFFGRPRWPDQYRFGNLIVIPNKERPSWYDLSKLAILDIGNSVYPPEIENAGKVLKARFPDKNNPDSRLLTFRRFTEQPWVISQTTEEGTDIGQYQTWDPQSDTLGEQKTIAKGFPIFPTRLPAMLCLRDEGEEEIAWTHLDHWSLEEGKRTASFELDPSIASIDIRISSDGKLLFLLEYMLQQIYLYDTSTGKAIGVIEGDGGFAAMDISPDGKTLVANGGKWIKGDLIANHMYVYDLTDVVESLSKEKKVDEKAAGKE